MASEHASELRQRRAERSPIGPIPSPLRSSLPHRDETVTVRRKTGLGRPDLYRRTNDAAPHTTARDIGMYLVWYVDCWTWSSTLGATLGEGSFGTGPAVGGVSGTPPPAPYAGSRMYLVHDRRARAESTTSNRRSLRLDPPYELYAQEPSPPLHSTLHSLPEPRSLNAKFSHATSTTESSAQETSK